MLSMLPNIDESICRSSLFDTSVVVAGDWESEHEYEDVWSNVRLARSAAFHEGHYILAGQKVDPNQSGDLE